MDEFDDIDDLYQDMINKFSGKPDDKGWSRLENNLNLEDVGVENWYKDKIENSTKIPDEKVWEDISMKIDTDSVWKRLAASLQRRDRIIWWWQFSASSFTLLAAIGLILFSQFPKEENSIVENKGQSKMQMKRQPSEKQLSSAPFSNKIIKNNGNKLGVNNELEKVSSIPSTIAVTNKSKAGVREPKVSKKVIATPSNASKNVLSEKSTSNDEEKFMKEKQNDNSHPFSKFSIISAMPFITEVKLENSLPTKISIPFDFSSLLVPSRRDYFYVEAQLINPWLMNSNTYTALRRNSADYNQTLFTGGVSLGYVHWLDKFGIEGNISFQEKGHNYMVSIEGKSYEKKINLDYALASFQIKKSINKNKLKPWESYIFGGLYYGRVIHQNTVFNGAPYTSEIDYAKNDFGIVFNFETQLKYKKNNIALGLGITQGLKNIYKGADYFEFNKTYNFTFIGSVKYLISVKK